MHPKLTIRIATIILLAGTMLACAIDVARWHHDHEPLASSVNENNDPSAAELARCKALGADAVNDAACKAAWAKSRERFFAPGTPYQGRPINPFPAAPDVPAKAPSQTEIDHAPLAPPVVDRTPGVNSDGH